MARWGLMQTEIKEFAMTTPRELPDISIAQLWTLTHFLGEQLGEGREGAEPATAETRACHEILRSLSRAYSEASSTKALK